MLSNAPTQLLGRGKHVVGKLNTCFIRYIHCRKLVELRLQKKKTDKDKKRNVKLFRGQVICDRIRILQAYARRVSWLILIG